MLSKNRFIIAGNFIISENSEKNDMILGSKLCRRSTKHQNEEEK